MENASTTKTIDLGNNESVSSGVFETPDGFVAMTYTQSKTFKTRAGAERWHARKTGKAPQAASSGFACLECGHKFKTLAGAEKAAFGERGCPKCGGADIDLSAK